MKNDTRLQTCLTDLSSPTDGQITKMKQNILDAVQPLSDKQPKVMRPRLPLKAIIAAAMVAVLTVTGISAAPAIREFFFPGVGVVEMESENEPLYMIVNTDEDVGADYEILYGYWYNGKATVQIKSATRYEELEPAALFDTEDAVLTLETVDFTYDFDLEQNAASVQEYRIVFNSLPYDEIGDGIRFGDTVLHFDRMPIDYQPYIKEDKGLRLTLIPMTLDYTVFAAEISYTNREEALTLQTRSDYLSPQYGYAMYLVDSAGITYPLIKDRDSIFYRIEDTPLAPVVGFRAEHLIFCRDFAADGQKTIVTIPLPEQGEAAVLDQQFIFPDGIIGSVHAVGYDNAITEGHYIDKETEFPLGYLSVITEAVEQNGIRYWCELFYTDEYYEYLSRFTAMEERNPYELSHLTPLSPKHRISLIGSENMVHHTEHYVSDGMDTVDLVADYYIGIAPGDWNIDFTRAAK